MNDTPIVSSSEDSRRRMENAASQQQSTSGTNTTTTTTPNEEVPARGRAVMDPSLPGGLRRVCILPAHVSTAWDGGDAETPHDGCLTLVSRYRLEHEIDRPRQSGVERFVAASPTLRYLREGYFNYVENDPSHEVHVLTAFTCRSSALKLVTAYKSISCKRPPPATPHADPGGSGRCRSTTSDMDITVDLISEYMEVFAELVDFHFVGLMPSLKTGLCNALVVDKRWSPSPANIEVNIPYYYVFAGDRYTGLALSKVLEMDFDGAQIRYVKFISTTTTRLYTNKRALQAPTYTPSGSGAQTERPGGRGGGKEYVPASDVGAETVVLSESPDGGGVVVEGPDVGEDSRSGPTVAVTERTSKEGQPPPSKRRRLDTLCEEGEEKEAGCTTADAPAAEEETYGATKCVSGEKDEPLNINATVGPPEWWHTVRPPYSRIVTDARNPTLIVFRHSFDKDDKNTIVFNIIAEVNLGDAVRY